MLWTPAARNFRRLRLETAMASTEPSPVTVSYGALGWPQSGRSAVVWLRGEHDISTVAALTGTLARVIAIDDADLVVDLSEVRFMGAAPVEVLVRAREFLRVRSRLLTLRSPSAWLSRVLERHGLADLVDPRPLEATHAVGPAGALGT
jgi:anti-anti-sigma factor